MAKDCCFTADIPAASTLDPKKRVRYFTGQVLGEDEFRQDQLYLMTRDELHQRALHGYGRVSGLYVDQRPGDDGGVEIVVGPGLAVNPRGETICVSQAQCAELNLWLESNRTLLLGSPPLGTPGAVTLYLVLCARECETDLVPVLGDPCRVSDEATAPSRIAEDFSLCFRLEPPDHAEERAIRALGALLRSIEITDSAPGMAPEELADLVRETFLAASPPESFPTSPPMALSLHPELAPAAIAEALAVWVAEVRPTLNPETGACSIPRDGDAGRCVLIGCLDVTFDEGAGGLEAAGPVVIDGACGPLLLQTRLLQELGMTGIVAGVAFPAPGSPPEDEDSGSPEPEASPPGELAAPDPALQQIVALSWVHDRASLLRIEHDGAAAFGLALGFGSAAPGAALVDARTLTSRTVRVSLRQQADVAPGGLRLLTRREIVPEEIVPVEIRTVSGQIAATRTTPGPGAPGVLFRISAEAARALQGTAAMLFVELVADHILDLDGIPIASHFPRGPAVSATQGGRFESWVTVDLPRIILAGVDLNRDDAESIRRLPGIGNSLATRIVAAREESGGFDRLEDLLAISGISESLVETSLRPLLET